MRRTVPFLCGICRRGPSVGSAVADPMVAGVPQVRQMPVDYPCGSRAFTCTTGAGPSDPTTALPRASSPVTTRRTGFAICLRALQRRLQAVGTLPHGLRLAGGERRPPHAVIDESVLGDVLRAIDV